MGERVRETPDALAVREALTGRELSYRNLWELAGATATRLAALGIGPGAVVALDLDRGADLVVAALAVIRTGAGYLPVDGSAPADRVAVILSDSRAQAVLVGDGSARRSRAIHLPRAMPVLTVVRETEGGASSPAEPTDTAVFAPAVDVDEESPLCVGYTSGSTGVPKGVVVPHRAVRDLVSDPAAVGAITAADRVAQLANPAFDAFTWEVWGALTAGAPLIVLPTVVEVDLARWSGLLAYESISSALLTTSLFHMVSREAPGSLGCLRQLLVGGEQLDLAAAERVLAAGAPQTLLNIYGPTETTVFATAFACTQASLTGRRRVPVGTAVRRAQLHVLDDRMQPVPDGETGELYIGGPSVTKGYLHQPERTAHAYRELDGHGLVYRTGDLVRRLADGELEVVGRADRQVKLRGFRIELEEIEQAAVATGHAEAAFVEKLGEGHTARLVGAFLRPDRRAVPDTGAAGAGPAGRLAAALASRLPTYMLPALWLPLEDLPLGSTGKADRTRIRALLAEFADSAAQTAPGAAAPAADLSADPAASARTGSSAAEGAAHTVAVVWAELLGLPGPEALRPTDDFLGLGGNSILATQAAFRIAERLGTPVDPTDILLTPSLTALAAQLDGSVAADR
ncbi:non-ribosomal peptide synthetase [Streptacidiphilus sp. BW17]|uniref:non-ribosomal peptide synthetase n=1 Tax=Streptacidiphilus sp. BW17 TaxID=3156274 RepID=UPI0035172BF9